MAVLKVEINYDGEGGGSAEFSGFEGTKFQKSHDGLLDVLGKGRGHVTYKPEFHKPLVTKNKAKVIQKG